MAENMCLMLMEAESQNMLARVLSLATAAVTLHKRTVLYVDEEWLEIAKPGNLQKRDRPYRTLFQISPVELLRYFQQAGGQLWVSAWSVRNLDLARNPLIEGAIVVDDQTLMTFLAQETTVLNF